VSAINDIISKRDQIVSIVSHYKIFNVKLSTGLFGFSACLYLGPSYNRVFPTLSQDKSGWDATGIRETLYDTSRSIAGECIFHAVCR